MLKIYKVKKESNSAVQSALNNDAFARNGYIYREGATLGLGEEYYLYIKGHEDFFKEQKELLNIEGMEKLADAEFEKVKEAIEKEQDDVASGISLFD
ncbi:hypothetical protein K8R43_03565 [archaeon]|nr:hypothetical protein [archaeon]